MDDSTFKSWWQLHVRAARGESLTSDEHARYEAIRAVLENDEAYQPLRSANLAREEHRVLEIERSQLEQHRVRLDAEIAALEGRLGQQTRQLLGVE